MISENIYEVVECAYSQDKHLLHEALALSCGHFICKKCVPSSHTNIKCFKCNTINKNDLKSSNESQIIKFYMSYHLKDLNHVIKEKIAKEVDIIKRN